jgi:uncharacterized protein (DUF169 family)
VAPTRWKAKEWLAALQPLHLDLPPVGVKFCSKPPEDMQQVEGSLRLCEMLRRAQDGQAFYAAPENHACGGGLYIMGKSLPHAFTTGEYAAAIRVYDDFKTGRRIYDSLPRLDADSTVDYVAFAPLQAIPFSPDLLIILGHPDQTEVLLRAYSYTTGKPWMSRCTGVIGCAWTYMYPYITGDLNFVVTGLSLGMRAGKLYSPGLQLITIPSDLFPMFLDNLKHMPPVLPLLQPGADEFRRNVLVGLGLDPDH